jgi:hypothetical protein
MRLELGHEGFKGCVRLAWVVGFGEDSGKEGNGAGLSNCAFFEFLDDFFAPENQFMLEKKTGWLSLRSFSRRISKSSWRERESRRYRGNDRRRASFWSWRGWETREGRRLRDMSRRGGDKSSTEGVGSRVGSIRHLRRRRDEGGRDLIEFWKFQNLEPHENLQLGDGKWEMGWKLRIMSCWPPP